MGIIIPCIYWIKTTPPNKSNQQSMDIKILMLFLMAFMAFGLSNAKRGATEVEKSRCIEPCEREKQQVESGNIEIERTYYYKYVTYVRWAGVRYDGGIFEDCTDFCIDRSRFLAQIEHNEIDSE